MWPPQAAPHHLAQREAGALTPRSLLLWEPTSEPREGGKKKRLTYSDSTRITRKPRTDRGHCDMNVRERGGGKNLQRVSCQRLKELYLLKPTASQESQLGMVAQIHSSL